MERFYQKIMFDPNTGCWLWTAAKNKAGYGIIRINKKNERAHRVSYLIHKGEIPEGLFVCHSCDNPGCVNPDHLFVEQYRGHNDSDRNNKGRTAKGNKLPQAKLNEYDVKEIRKISNIYSQHKIAKLYNVTQSVIHDIIHRKSWKHVE